MNKDRILFGIVGLAVGLVIGFLLANNINRSASIVSDVKSSSESSSQSAGLPPNHPPIDEGGGASQGGALPEVTAAIEKARKETGNFEAQMTAGDLYYQIQRFDGAIEFYEKARKLRPEANEPLIKLGNTYFDAERYEDAERQYSTVLKRTPNDVNVRTDLGLTFYLRTPRDVDRAIQEYNTALKIDPSSEIALQNLALAYKEKNDQDNLKKTSARLSEINPNNPVLRQNPPPN